MRGHMWLNKVASVLGPLGAWAWGDERDSAAPSVSVTLHSSGHISVRIWSEWI